MRKRLDKYKFLVQLRVEITTTKSNHFKSENEEKSFHLVLQVKNQTLRPIV